MPSINVRRLSKRYLIGARHRRRELWALRDISFNVEAGEILGIIGPNGAGKTTLLKVLSRVTPPTEGRVVGSGRVVPLLALGAGFQQDVSGRENIYLNAAIYGVPATDVNARLDDIIEFADIGDYIDVPVRRYSNGMYMRLAFSVAINMNPDILLADEVLAVGDIDFQERCLERVQQAGRDGMIVLFVSHDMGAISRLCTRVLWLNAGEIVKSGEPDEVVAAYQNVSWSTTGRRMKDRRTGSHKNTAGEVLFVTLTAADGREIGAVRADDEVLVKVGVRIDMSPAKVRFVLDFSAHGSVAFQVRSEFFPVNDTGVHLAVIRVPPDLLAETIYTISAEIMIAGHGPEKFPAWAYNALSFQVFDPAAVGRRETVVGMVAPKVQWTFNPESQLPTGTSVSAQQKDATQAGAARGGQ